MKFKFMCLYLDLFVALLLRLMLRLPDAHSQIVPYKVDTVELLLEQFLHF